MNQTGQGSLTRSHCLSAEEGGTLSSRPPRFQKHLSPAFSSHTVEGGWVKDCNSAPQRGEEASVPRMAWTLSPHWPGLGPARMAAPEPTALCTFRAGLDNRLALVAEQMTPWEQNLSVFLTVFKKPSHEILSFYLYDSQVNKLFTANLRRWFSNRGADRINRGAFKNHRHPAP